MTQSTEGWGDSQQFTGQTGWSWSAPKEAWRQPEEVVKDQQDTDASDRERKPGDWLPGRVAVVGAGQVGTMLGLALRAAGSSSGISEVVLSDRNPVQVQRSLERGAGHRIAHGIEDILAADTVILALPVPEIVAWVGLYGGRLAPGTLLLDTGSTKGPVVAAIRRRVGATVHAVGGHPLAGTEHPGPDGAIPEMLEGAAFVLTPVREDPAALARAQTLVCLVGARPLVMDAAAHDRTVALSSHVPHVLAYALAAAAQGEGAETQILRAVVSTGFQGATRLASSDPAMVAGFLSANAGEVRRAIAAVRLRLDDLDGALEDTPRLRDLLAAAARSRAALLTVPRESPS